MVKGITRQVILVKSPDPKLFEEAIFIVKEEALSREGVSADQVIRQARQAADGYLKGNRAWNRRLKGFPVSLSAPCGGGGGRPGLRHLVRGAALAVRRRRCERTGLNGRFFCAGEQEKFSLGKWGEAWYNFADKMRQGAERRRQMEGKKRRFPWRAAGGSGCC